jgi:hypothetical protein
MQGSGTNGMCSVDPGWISKGAPQPMQAETRKAPLDMEDGVARVLDPVFRGLKGTPIFGQFLKNFRNTPW